MFIISLFSAATALVLAYYYLFRKRGNGNFPPGPAGLPIIGNVHQLDGNAHESFAKLRENYGDIYSLKMGSLSAVVLHDAKLIKEAFNKDEFSGRPTFPHFLEPNTGIQRGLALSNGEAWEEQRKFTINTLHNFGLKYGSRNMETLINEEVNLLIDDFASSSGKPIQTNRKFAVAVVNSLWILITGERFEHNDPKMDKLLIELYKMTTNAKSQGAFIFFPWFAKYFPNMSGFNQHVKRMAPLHEMITECINSHKQNYEEGSQLDFIDCYLEEIEKSGQTKASFTGKNGDANLMMTVHDLFVAGGETTSSALTWICLLLAHYPKVQQKLREEILQVVGMSRRSCLNDRPSLPYCEAMILETFRFTTIFPLGVFRSTTTDVEFHGYTIPKNTLILPNFWFVDHDPKIWGDPENFRPERFLSADGKAVLRHESSTPFGSGKRVCPGEGLARDELFLFSTAIIQRFDIGFVPGKPIPPLKHFVGAAIASPLPHELQMTDRFNL